MVKKFSAILIAICVVFTMFASISFALAEDFEVIGQKIVATGQSVEAKYENKKSYYFKVEPIKWYISNKSNKTLTLQSDLILDSAYVNLYKNMGNVVEGSYLHNWLNDKSGVYNSILSNYVSL